MSEKIYKIGTRKSPLALKQVEEIIYMLKNYYPDIKTDIIGFETCCDKDKITPISDIEGTDFFTKEIDQALLNEDIDFAVHSAKDLPDIIPEGLYVATITKSKNPYDALVSKNNIKIDKLPYGAKIGISSSRRKIKLKKYRKDFVFIDIRGTIEERIERLYKTDMDAIIVAEIALIRLGLEEKITQRIPLNILTPHSLQGCLAIVVKKNNKELIKMLEIIGKSHYGNK